MRLMNNNVETLPIDMILVLMQILLTGGFQDFYNFFIAWARTQRAPVIQSLLEEFPMRSLFKYGGMGSDGDKVAFHRFFRIGAQLGIGDAILYQRCKAIICGEGNIESHISVIEGLASGGHFLSMVANFGIRVGSRKECCTNTLEEAVIIYKYPNYKKQILPALTDLGAINSCFPVADQGEDEVCEGGCPIHGLKRTLLEKATVMDDCVFCNIVAMANVFSKRVVTPCPRLSG